MISRITKSVRPGRRAAKSFSVSNKTKLPRLKKIAVTVPGFGFHAAVKDAVRVAAVHHKLKHQLGKIV